MINKDALVDSLRDLADRDFQQQVWSGRVPHLVSSFPELVCQVFDDTGLSDALEAGAVRAELGEEVADLVRRLDAAVSVVDPSLPVDQLVVSQGMRDVRELARRLLDALQH